MGSGASIDWPAVRFLEAMVPFELVARRHSGTWYQVLGRTHIDHLPRADVENYLIS